MSKETTYAGQRGDWQGLLDRFAANAEELSYLEVNRLKLQNLLTRAQELSTQQAALTAAKQELSLLVKDVMAEGGRVATVLRQSLKTHYGVRAEKLAEFGVKPFRGRSRKVKAKAKADAEVAAQPSVQTPDSTE